MLWVLMALLVLVAGMSMMLRRRQYETVETEPWRASLADEREPLDMEEIRRAEDEWLSSDEWDDGLNDGVDDEGWRGT
jgi:hypothetical protein